MYTFNNDPTVIQAPCLHCLDRHSGCHSKCEKYISYKERLKEANEEELRKKRSNYRHGRKRHY